MSCFICSLSYLQHRTRRHRRRFSNVHRRWQLTATSPLPSLPLLVLLLMLMLIPMRLLLLLLMLMLMRTLMVLPLPIRMGICLRVIYPASRGCCRCSLLRCCSRCGLLCPQIGAFANGDFPFDGRIGAVAVFDSSLSNEQVKEPIDAWSVSRSINHIVTTRMHVYVLVCLSHVRRERCQSCSRPSLGSRAFAQLRRVRSIVDVAKGARSGSRLLGQVLLCLL